jgi:hypothetical protein
MVGSIIPVRYLNATVSEIFEKEVAFAGRIIDISALSCQRENGV